MVATLTWNLDANGMTFATSFSITTQARRVRTGRIKFSCLGRLLWAGLFASVCSPPRLSTTQLTLATRSGHVSTGLGLSPVSFMFSSSHAAGPQCGLVSHSSTTDSLLALELLLLLARSTIDEAAHEAICATSALWARKKPCHSTWLFCDAEMAKRMNEVPIPKSGVGLHLDRRVSG